MNPNYSVRAKSADHISILKEKRDPLLPIDLLCAHVSQNDITTTAGHRVLSECPSQFMQASYLHGITATQRFSAGKFGVVFSVPGIDQLLKINPHVGKHMTGHPAILDHVEMRECKIGGYTDSFYITNQPKIQTENISQRDIDLIDAELSRFFGKDDRYVDYNDVGVIYHDGERIPLCFDFHSALTQSDFSAAIERSRVTSESMPPSLWVDPHGRWRQHLVFPELAENRIRGTVNPFDALQIANQLSEQRIEAPMSSVILKNIVNHSISSHNIITTMDLIYSLTELESILLSGYLEHEIEEIFSPEFWKTIVKKFASGELSAADAPSDPFRLSERRAIVDRRRSQPDSPS